MLLLPSHGTIQEVLEALLCRLHRKPVGNGSLSPTLQVMHSEYPWGVVGGRTCLPLYARHILISSVTSERVVEIEEVGCTVTVHRLHPNKHSPVVTVNVRWENHCCDLAKVDFLASMFSSHRQCSTIGPVTHLVKDERVHYADVVDAVNLELLRQN